MTPEQQAEYDKLRHTDKLNERGVELIKKAIADHEAQLVVAKLQLIEAERDRNGSRLKLIDFELFQLHA